MDILSPQFSMLAIVGALLVGFVAGRLTAPQRFGRASGGRRHDSVSDARNLAQRLSPNARQTALRLLERDQPIEAIKIIRADLNCGLAEAKAIVEAIAPRRP